MTDNKLVPPTLEKPAEIGKTVCPCEDKSQSSSDDSKRRSPTESRETIIDYPLRRSESVPPKQQSGSRKSTQFSFGRGSLDGSSTGSTQTIDLWRNAVELWKSECRRCERETVRADEAKSSALRECDTLRRKTEEYEKQIAAWENWWNREGRYLVSPAPKQQAAYNTGAVAQPAYFGQSQNIAGHIWRNFR